MNELLQMPMWTCPTCGNEQQEDEYYDLREGDALTCGGCRTEFAIVETETVMYITINAKGRT